MDVFSGRANPAWLLTPDQGRQFLAQLHTLARCGGAQPVPPHLGYRGVCVTGPPLPFAHVRIWAGVAAVTSAQGTALFGDPGRALERWLVASAGDPALYRRAFGD